MATMTIRNLPDDLHQRLRIRAAERGHSMEAEVRSILAEAIPIEEPKPYDPQDLLDFVRDLYGGELPTGVVDELIAERRAESAREP